jgi:hypothetical protein
MPLFAFQALEDRICLRSAHPFKVFYAAMDLFKVICIPRIYDEQEIIKILVANDRICGFWRKFLKKDFDKKLNAKYGDEIKYSRLYHIVKKYYDLRVRPYGV